MPPVIIEIVSPGLTGGSFNTKEAPDSMSTCCRENCFTTTLSKMGAEVPSDRSQFKILVVDDDQGIRAILHDFLEDEGFGLSLAEDGHTGIEKAETEQPALIISDMKMPGISGCEMIRALRSRGIEIPVLFMTGYTEYELLSGAIQLQPIGFLEKPFELTALKNLVERAFQQMIGRLSRDLIEQELKKRVEETTRMLQFKTERLEAEKNIVSGIISQANFGLLAVDSESCLHMINKMAIELLQLSPEQSAASLGADLRGLLPEALQRPLIDSFDEVKRSGKLVEREFWLQDESRKIHLVTYAVRFHDEISAVVFVMHDITEKENLQRSLLQSSKLASIGELAAGVAHEINNPLGFVISNCNTLKSYYQSNAQYVAEIDGWIKKAGALQKPVSELISYMQPLKEKYEVDYLLEDGVALLKETLDGLSRVSKIVVDLKSFARADRDTMEQADINKLVGDALNLVRNETKYKMEVVTELAELPATFCLPNQLVQVFTNLFVNACHAVTERGTLNIKTSQTRGKIQIEIADNGKGIPENIISRIFDPFFTTKEQGKGTGMGLSISYGILEKHNGSIAVESKVGVGTRFTVRIPIRAEAPAIESTKLSETSYAQAQ